MRLLKRMTGRTVGRQSGVIMAESRRDESCFENS